VGKREVEKDKQQSGRKTAKVWKRTLEDDVAESTRRDAEHELKGQERMVRVRDFSRQAGK